ncbi:ABC transporter ATP-binding protein [Histidinibacterium lentulum]|uniref:ABC transporter ATP-binding protein n=1 Tax=Histidinibacterium lentulum TaxID=2480588 RepID=A0A3N2QRK5_9RHOB|nr:ABC transporter ATP-binding protein [Histidinibacterium lentulum]ROT97824.1 ABC transporter ATP-binding protein [Histidinibacterium lentulum]
MNAGSARPLDPALGKAAAPPVIEIDGVSVRFDSAQGPVDALSDINLGIAAGSFTSIIGRSGCGKSTLLRAITGLIRPTSGSVQVQGQSSADYQRTRRFGFVFQGDSLFPWKTAAGNVEMPMEVVQGMPRAARRKRAEELLRLVRLDGFEDHYPAQLSGGMRQRVSIARALSYEPEILMMDEPFGALDEFTRREMHDEVIRIWRSRPLTVLFVTHSLSEALYLSDRIVVMAPRPGRVKAVIEVETPRPLDPSARTSAAYLRQMTELEALLDA